MAKKFIFIILLSCITLLLSSCGVIAGSAGMNRVEDTSNKTMAGENIKAMDVSTPVGSVKINSYDGDDIHVIVKKINTGFKDKEELRDELKNAEVIFKEEGDLLSIKAYLPKFKDNGMSIELDISVPTSVSSYKVRSEVGDVRLSNLKGNMDVTNNVGKVGMDGCSGVVNLKTTTGDVAVRESSIKGNSSLTSNVGRVLFDGTIDPQGSYSMITNTGKVDVTLGEGASFDIDASADIGEIECGFDVEGTMDKRRVLGKINGGGPKVSLKSNVGSISLNKR